MSAGKKCPVCARSVSSSRWACIKRHFALYAPGQWRYWRGNVKTFGWLDGIAGSIGITFPFIDTLMNWRHRKSRLDIDESLF